MRGTMIFLKKKRNAVGLLIILIVVMANLFVYPYIYQKICQDRRYDDLENKLNDDYDAFWLTVFEYAEEHLSNR